MEWNREGLLFTQRFQDACDMYVPVNVWCGYIALAIPIRYMSVTELKSDDKMCKTSLQRASGLTRIT